MAPRYVPTRYVLPVEVRGEYAAVQGNVNTIRLIDLIPCRVPGWRPFFFSNVRVGLQDRVCQYMRTGVCANLNNSALRHVVLVLPTN